MILTVLYDKMGTTHMFVLVLLLIVVFVPEQSKCMLKEEKERHRQKVLEMFHHAYRSYMDYAYPADELMPLSCKGRYRGTQTSRGDVDDALGNFSLTLIDTLDTLVVLGEVEEFEKAVTLVVNGVNFDNNVVVSVFETNIRVLGGLLGGHVMARYLKSRKKGMDWYTDELLEMAKDLGYRLLPAFNTTTGMPYPRVNLRYGVKHSMSRTGQEKDTCTACAGTMVLEFSALSRLTGEPIFEEKAHKAMDYLWKSRHRTSDLVGTVINIHNGDWVRRDSGVGAGIDSYYEYMLKAYILLGDETYLTRFNKHYAGIRKYISQGPLLVDVHMHKPLTNSRNFMDALLAFWPGLQVLIGDMKPAIETHEMLYQVIQKHNFLPEAFTTDFRVHWAQHPLRPEFLESTYFLFKATGDDHYLDVGLDVMNNLETIARVKCGYAAIKDVTTGAHEDQMDSYVLAETFKYLYLLFTEPSQLIVDVDKFVFTTEAHLLPLSLAIKNGTANGTRIPEIDLNVDDDDDDYERTCPNTNHVFKTDYAKTFRDDLKNMVENSCPVTRSNSGNIKFAWQQEAFLLHIVDESGEILESYLEANIKQAENDRKETISTSLSNLEKWNLLILGLKQHTVGPQFLQTTTASPSCKPHRRPRFKAAEFMAGNKDQMELLKKMGITIITMNDGRVQLLHTASGAASTEEAEDGMAFMQEMIELSKSQVNEAQHEPRTVQYLLPPDETLESLPAGPAQFGYELKKGGVKGRVVMTVPRTACQDIANVEEIRGKIAILERGDCMFVDKARQIQAAGAIGGLILDNHAGTSSATQPLFAMSGDGKDDISIPLLFMFHEEGQKLINSLEQYEDLQVCLTYKAKTKDEILADLSRDDDTTSVGVSDFIVTSGKTSSQGNKLELAGIKVEFQSLNPTVEVPKDGKNPNKYLMQVISGPDNTKQIKLDHDQFVRDKQAVGPILSELLTQLLQHTNFKSLEQPMDYLGAISKMLEAMAKENYNIVGVQDLRLLEQLSKQLKPKGKESEETESAKDDIDSDMQRQLDRLIALELKKVLAEATPSGSQVSNVETPDVSNLEGPEMTSKQEQGETLEPYATMEELEAHAAKRYGPGGIFEKTDNKYPRYLPPNAKQAPEWLSLKPGEVVIDKDGSIYVDLKHSYWDWTRQGNTPEGDPQNSQGKSHEESLDIPILSKDSDDVSIMQQFSSVNEHPSMGNVPKTKPAPMSNKGLNEVPDKNHPSADSIHTDSLFSHGSAPHSQRESSSTMRDQDPSNERTSDKEEL